MLLQLDQAGGRERAALAGCSSRDAATARASLPHHSLLPLPTFLPFSPVCLFLALILLSVRPFHLSHLATPLHPNISFIADGDFYFLTLRATDFISEKLKRRGKATSTYFLGHFSIGEYNNYFSLFLFSCLYPVQGPTLVPSVSTRMLNATSQFLQAPGV